MKNTFIALFSIILLASCSNTPGSGSNSSERLLALTNTPNNPNVIALHISDRKDGDTSITYTAKALYKEDTVGFSIAVGKNIPAGINADGSVNSDVGFITGAIAFINSGPESDRFVTALAELWGVTGFNRMKEQPIRPVVFSSNRVTVDHDKQFTYSFKLFFEADTSSEPGEVFFTFDTFKRSIQFQEKDSIYRQQLVHAFGE